MDVARRRVWSVQLAMLAGCVLVGATAQAQHYTQDNLVSDQPGAPFTDANLSNPWGLARTSTSIWLSANNRTGTATFYNGVTGQPSSLVLTIPSSSGDGAGAPTGAVFNGTSSFGLTSGSPRPVPARFLFVTLDGTISGWHPALGTTRAVVQVRTPGAAYTGAAIASRKGAHFLYVANFAQGRIEVFDSAFRLVDLIGDDTIGTEQPRVFRDDRIPSGFAPFNVQNIGGVLYVTFAKRDPVTTVAAGPGLGYVDVFSPDGRLLRRLEHGPWLNAPWGIAQAPGDFGAFSHNLLVGQFRSGEIAAYDAASGAFVGKVLKSTSDEPVVLEGLWALSFGNGLSAGQLNALFFTAGIEEERHGLFGALFPLASEQLLGNGK